MKCQVKGCAEEAKYALYRTIHSNKKWVYVCARHERIIGDKNVKDRQASQRQVVTNF